MSKEEEEKYIKSESDDDCVMLAHAYDEKLHKGKVDGWWISEKFDGVRATWDGKHFVSRNGNEYTIPEFLKKQLKQIDKGCLPLDGELWFGYNTFTVCSGAARKDKIDDEVWKNAKYLVFDIQDTKLKFEERLNKFKTVLSELKLPNVYAVKFKQFNPETMNIDEELKKVENKGGEGLMIRKPGSMYVYKRSKDMLKVKSWCFKEAEVVCYVRGTGRLKDMVGSLLVKTDQLSEDGKIITFRVGTGLTDYQRYSGKVDWESKKTVQEHIEKNRKIYEKEHSVSEDFIKEKNKLIEKYKKESSGNKFDKLSEFNKIYQTMPTIGSVITFKYKELNKNGVPSFPVYVGVRDYE